MWAKDKHEKSQTLYFAVGTGTIILEGNLALYTKNSKMLIPFTHNSASWNLS